MQLPDPDTEADLLDDKQLAEKVLKKAQRAGVSVETYLMYIIRMYQQEQTHVRVV
ncbi:hypothetical protein PP747_gp011 [Rhizobium phage RHph_Y38]|uniref:Uncharacterized protein n=1 Tax=Rhizobium phage RHph_Y38 TaxID=2509781 RepID=A0A7S5QX41_9CAUD|nr:hypothetical protein PP747_gp011 [Rhizobium phage RHph_Y38]QIG67712.1 hypothetical protein EVB52_011 [Rhizobium phage RHph_Y38]QXV74781.1 hypothetical protein [Rhizobium phage RHEph24]